MKHILSTAPFPSLLHLWRHLNTPPRKGNWRIVDPEIGGFHALPEFRGVAIASDGCQLMVQKENGAFITGHVTNWQCDEVPPELLEQRRKARTSASAEKHGISPAITQLLLAD